MKGLGYREWFPYFKGNCTREDVIRTIKLNTRHFAKRQLTWFRREQDVTWISLPVYNYDPEQVVSYMKTVCREKGLIQ